MKKSFIGFLVMHENNCPLIDALIFPRSHIFGGRQGNEKYVKKGGSGHWPKDWQIDNLREKKDTQRPVINPDTPTLKKIDF